MIENIGELFTEKSQSYAERAYKLALKQRHSTIEEANVLLALLEDPDELLIELFAQMSLDVESLKQEIISAMMFIKKVPFWKGRKYKFFTTPTVKSSLEDAVFIANNLGEGKVSPIHIFWGVINSALKEQQNGLGQIFRSNNVSAENVLDELKKIHSQSA